MCDCICQNEEVIVTEQIYDNEEYKCSNEKSLILIIPYECTMLNNFELYNVHIECAEIEKWSILNTEIDYVTYNRLSLPTNRVKFNLTERKYLGSYRQIKREDRPYREVDFGTMT